MNQADALAAGDNALVKTSILIHESRFFACHDG
jgi:hypothetical protein